MKKIEFVDGAKQWYKHWSTWGIAALGAFPLIAEHADKISAVIPADKQPYWQLALAVIVAVSRFIKQRNIAR